MSHRFTTLMIAEGKTCQLSNSTTNMFYPYFCIGCHENAEDSKRLCLKFLIVRIRNALHDLIINLLQSKKILISVIKVN